MQADSKFVTAVVEASHGIWRQGRRSPMRLIVLHDAQTGETVKSARGSAGWFASGKSGGSAHICCDNLETIQCVPFGSTAFGAPGVNDCGFHVEQAGVAAQTGAQWDDPYSHQMIGGRVVPIVAEVMSVNKIPVKWVTAADLAVGYKSNWDINVAAWQGITTHRESTAWRLAAHLPTAGHQDPGPNYPIARVVALVAAMVAHP